MKTSKRGVVEIAQEEGVVPTVYFDSRGIETYGVGHTASAGDPDPAKMSKLMPSDEDMEEEVDKALRLFATDLKKYESRVNRAIKVPLEQYQFDALVSFDFNTGGIFRAKLTEQINSGDMSGDGFMGWLRPPEIRKRRTNERNLFRTGDYSANGDSVPVWETNGRGKLIKVHTVMSGGDILKRLGREKRPSGRKSILNWLLRLIGVGR